MEPCGIAPCNITLPDFSSLFPITEIFIYEKQDLQAFQHIQKRTTSIVAFSETRFTSLPTNIEENDEYCGPFGNKIYKLSNKYRRERRVLWPFRKQDLQAFQQIQQRTTSIVALSETRFTSFPTNIEENDEYCGPFGNKIYKLSNKYRRERRVLWPFRKQDLQAFQQIQQRTTSIVALSETRFTSFPTNIEENDEYCGPFGNKIYKLSNKYSRERRVLWPFRKQDLQAFQQIQKRTTSIVALSETRFTSFPTNIEENDEYCGPFGNKIYKLSNKYRRERRVLWPFRKQDLLAFQQIQQRTTSIVALSETRFTSFPTNIEENDEYCGPFGNKIYKLSNKYSRERRVLWPFRKQDFQQIQKRTKTT